MLLDYQKKDSSKLYVAQPFCETECVKKRKKSNSLSEIAVDDEVLRKLFTEKLPDVALTVHRFKHLIIDIIMWLK